MNNENNILNEEEELKKTAPVLSGVSKKDPFTVPDGYFETLSQTIMGKCQTNFPDKKWNWGFFPEYRTVMLVATVIVAFTIAIFFLFINPRQTVQKNEPDFTMFVPDDGLMNDLSDDMDESTIIETVLSESPENSSDSNILKRNDFLMENPDYTNDDLINYLLDANADMDNITQ